MNNPRNEDTVVLPRPKTVKAQKSASKLLAFADWDRDEILLVNTWKRAQTRRISSLLHFLTSSNSNWSPNVEASFRKESCVFKTMLLLTRRPLGTSNRRIFTLQFFSTRSTAPTWPLLTTASCITLRSSSRE
jgi:hypothetical protein